MTRSRPDSVMPSSSMKTAASSGSSSPSSISIRAESASTSAWSVVVAGRGPRRPASGAPARSPLADVEQHEDRLLGEEPEAADGLLLVGVEAEVADRRAGLEALVEPLRGRPPRARWPRARPASRGGRCPRSRSRRRSVIDRSASMNSRSSRSRSRAGSTLPSGCGSAGSSNARTTWSSASESRSRARWSAGQFLGPDVPLGRRRRGRQVDVGDVGLDDLLGLEDARPACRGARRAP